MYKETSFYDMLDVGISTISCNINQFHFGKLFSQEMNLIY
jgi:hypothetical protein